VLLAQPNINPVATVFLYVNPVTWTRSTTLADLTEASWTGYVPANLYGTPPYGGQLVGPGYGYGATCGQAWDSGTAPFFYGGAGGSQLIQGYFWKLAQPFPVLWGGAAFPVPFTIPPLVIQRVQFGFFTSTILGP